MLDTGATAFMLVSAMLVFLMTPGVAFFTADLRVVKTSSTPCSCRS